MSIVEKLVAGGLDQSEAERKVGIPKGFQVSGEAGNRRRLNQRLRRGATAAILEEQADSETEEAATEVEETTTEAEEAATEAEETSETGEDGEAEEAEESGETSDSSGDATAIEEEEAPVAPDVSALIANLMSAEIRGCALECNVDVKRLPVLIRLVDTSAIDPAAENLHDQVMAAVKSALKEVPELVRGGTASGSLGNHARVPAGTDDIAAKFRSGF